MYKIQTMTKVLSIVVAAALLQGCATHIRKPVSSPEPATKKISAFKSVQLQPVTIAEPFAANEANKKAARKIEENLRKEMTMVIPKLKSEAGDLVITPVIEEIKFIGGFARFMVGAMAGSSAVLMKVTYKDAKTGEVIAEPEFYRASNAMAGGYSVGASDNMMLTEIARDVANYTKLNM